MEDGGAKASDLSENSDICVSHFLLEVQINKRTIGAFRRVTELIKTIKHLGFGAIIYF